MRRLFVATMALACLSAPAMASQRGHHHHTSKASHGRHYAHHGGAWCGAYMRHVFGVSDPRLNLARNWASVGSSAGGPQVGAVVVWPHHVGVIRGGPDAHGDWLVESGNDGHAVRTRYRSLRGAIAFRSVGGGLTVAGAQQRYVRPTRNSVARYEAARNEWTGNQWAWPNPTIAPVADQRRRRIRIAQNGMESGEQTFHW
jgi:hypothetical protein